MHPHKTHTHRERESFNHAYHGNLLWSFVSHHPYVLLKGVPLTATIFLPNYVSTSAPSPPASPPFSVPFILYILLPQPLKESHFTIPKSRCSPISFYLSNDAYNDVKYPIDRDLYKKMRDEGDCLQCYVCVCVLWRERCAINWEGDVTQYI